MDPFAGRIFRFTPMFLGVLLATTVTLSTVAGCGPQDTDGGTDDAEDIVDADETGQEDASAGWLTGRWLVDHTLDQVSSALFEEAADQGEVVVTIKVEDGEMTMVVDDVVYTGVVVFSGDIFRFEGSAEYVEDDGSTTESDIIIDGTRFSQNAWNADMWGEIRAEGDLLYEAVWMQRATRLP